MTTESESDPGEEEEAGKKEKREKEEEEDEEEEGKKGKKGKKGKEREAFPAARETVAGRLAELTTAGR